MNRKPLDKALVSFMSRTMPSKTDVGSMYTFQDMVEAVLEEVRTLLLQKNESYGNSALEPIRVFSKEGATAQIRTRIDDKLSRIKHGIRKNEEDTVLDLLGYLVLLRIAEK
jgi:hypothetical protein